MDIVPDTTRARAALSPAPLSLLSTLRHSPSILTHGSTFTLSGIPVPVHVVSSCRKGDQRDDAVMR